MQVPTEFFYSRSDRPLLFWIAVIAQLAFGSALMAIEKNIGG